MMKNRKKRGFTLIESVIAVGLSSVVLLSSYKLMDNLNKTNSNASLAFQANQIRRDVIAVLQSPTGWHNTMWAAGNTTFACLQGYSDCSGQANNGPTVSTNATANYYSSNPTGAFDVYTPTSSINPVSTIYYQATSGTKGFTLNGAQCNTWSGTPFVAGGSTTETGTTSTSSLCPLRLVLWWVPICPNTTGQCISPTVHILGYMLYTPSAADKDHAVAFNPGNYGINFVVNPVPH
jgi:prepilin-type N-terminal cleavage/methylation domain-containing protein